MPCIFKIFKKYWHYNHDKLVATLVQRWEWGDNVKCKLFCGKTIFIIYYLSQRSQEYKYWSLCRHKNVLHSSQSLKDRNKKKHTTTLKTSKTVRPNKMSLNNYNPFQNILNKTRIWSTVGKKYKSLISAVVQFLGARAKNFFLEESMDTMSLSNCEIFPIFENVLKFKVSWQSLRLRVC